LGDILIRRKIIAPSVQTTLDLETFAPNTDKSLVYDLPATLHLISQAK